MWTIVCLRNNNEQWITRCYTDKRKIYKYDCRYVLTFAKHQNYKLAVSTDDISKRLCPFLQAFIILCMYKLTTIIIRFSCTHKITKN